MKEYFKNIKGYPDYQISNKGRIKSLSRKINCERGIRTSKEKILKPQLIKCGYLTIMLYEDKKPKLHYVHRLVLMAFKPNPNNYPQTNHKDGDKLNNSIDNLEWSTAKQNQRHAFKIGLHPIGSARPLAKLKESDIPLIRTFYKDGLTQKELGKKFGVPQQRISRIVNNQIWRHA